MTKRRTEERRKVGRPTKYVPAMCDTVIKLGKLGKSKAQIAAALGITKETFFQWEKQHTEFSDSIKVSTTYAQAWWEDKGQAGLDMGKDFNSTAFIFQVKNRFPRDYRDKHELEHDASHSFARVWEFIGAQKEKAEGEGE
jgi:DNA-binding XRE family transcriptional regulator